MVTNTMTVFRYAGLVSVLVLAFAEGQQNETDCEDSNSWCSLWAPKFCYVMSVKKECAKSCNICLPLECNKCEQNCTSGSNDLYECSCFSGFRLQSDGISCEDINECVENKNICPVDKICHNNEGAYSCDFDMCAPFYTQNYMLSVSYEQRCCKPTKGMCGQTIHNKNGTRIIDGEPAEAGVWPWMAYLPIRGEVCGGSLINNNWVISAAHCFSKVTDDDISSLKLAVYLGVINRTRASEHQMRQIAELIRHEKYAFPLNDVALVRLDRPAVFSDYVSPICLPNGEVPPDGTRCMTTGFGTTDPHGDTPSDVLQQVVVPIVNSEVCRKAYLSSINDVNTERMVCAGYEQGKKDSCRGDSGGPFVCQRCDSCDWFLAGVTSFGEGCAQKGYYGVYANVEFFEEWIESKIDNVTIKKAECKSPAWAEWGEWSECSRICNGGRTSRTRVCVGGMAGMPECPGDTVQGRDCNSHACGEDAWAQWSACSKTCGSGWQTRKRVCVTPNCETETDKQDCNTQPCPSWRLWSPWGECSASCGGGKTHRTRSCKNGKIGQDGCRGSRKAEKNCNEGACVEQWSEWSRWSPCSETCGLGERRKSRVCETGSNCYGENEMREECVRRKCLSVWATWSQWSDCSATCGDGERIRTRFCSSKKNEHVECLGEPNETEPCNAKPCQSKCDSLFCIPAVHLGYCVTKKAYMNSYCDPSCCTEDFCQDTSPLCSANGANYCYEQNNPDYVSFFRTCLRTCGYCQ